MLIELITPLMLATSPMVVTVNESVTYSHMEQKASGVSHKTSGFTPNATQTFDASGRPMDADND